MERFLMVTVNADEHLAHADLIEVPAGQCPWDRAIAEAPEGRFVIGVVEHDAIENHVLEVSLYGQK